MTRRVQSAHYVKRSVNLGAKNFKFFFFWLNVSFQNFKYFFVEIFFRWDIIFQDLVLKDLDWFSFWIFNVSLFLLLLTIHKEKTGGSPPNDQNISFLQNMPLKHQPPDAQEVLGSPHKEFSTTPKTTTILAEKRKIPPPSIFRPKFLLAGQNCCISGFRTQFWSYF